MEVEDGVDADKIYKIILTKIKAYIQPEVTYYTLQQLLDKGKSIEDIFAGRPYSTESFGFVDTAELEALEHRDRFNLSDIYNIILSVDGVRTVKNLTINGGQAINEYNQLWIEGTEIPANTVPCFNLNDTCIDIFSETGLLQVNKDKIHSTLTTIGKTRLGLAELDLPLPTGKYRADLGDYYSIQNDFPVVYGIGEAGLPPSASLLRKTQALQLKGYLLFFDQLLANYVAQLSNLHGQFSFQSSQETNVQIPDAVPGMEQLVSFYNQTDTAIDGLITAIPVANDAILCNALETIKSDPTASLTMGSICESNMLKRLIFQMTFVSVLKRETYINQLTTALNNGDFTIDICKDRYGFFFIIYPGEPEAVVLIGRDRYPSYNEAFDAANKMVFVASMTESYNVQSNKNTGTNPNRHSFNISNKPVAYVDFVKKISENDEAYLGRKKQFLDHLLARFAEQFSDYALTQYQYAGLNEKEIQSQSKMLSQYDEISRNRGKGFNYLKPSWNTDNVSGLEKRVACLTGIENYNRRNLCNFSVIQGFPYELPDKEGKSIFYGITAGSSNEAVNAKVEEIISNLKNPDTYPIYENELEVFEKDKIRRIFSERISDENIYAQEERYRIELFDSNGGIIKAGEEIEKPTSKKQLKLEVDFITKLNEVIDLFLLDESEKQYFDFDNLDFQFEKIEQWSWKMDEEARKSFDTKALAFQDLLRRLDIDEIISKENDGKFSFIVEDNNENIALRSSQTYENEIDAFEAFCEVFSLGKTKKNFDKIKNKKADYTFHLQNDYGVSLAIINQSFETAKARDEQINHYNAYFKKNDKPAEIYLKSNGVNWSIREDGEIKIKSDHIFENEELAEEDLKMQLPELLKVANFDFLKQYICTLKWTSRISSFRYIYGESDDKNNFKPLLMSVDTFENRKELDSAYKEFINELPSSKFKEIDDDTEYTFGIFPKGKRKPVAVEYVKGKKRGSSEDTQKTVAYVKDIYSKGTGPKITNIPETDTHNEGNYRWQFLKKNNPMAISPWICQGKDGGIDSALCTEKPPINLYECPKKDVVICPEKDPDKFHYQVKFYSADNGPFCLISYAGYDTAEAAFAAWEQEWFQIIQLAMNPENYGAPGIISIVEDYNISGADACTSLSIMAVVPNQYTVDVDPKIIVGQLVTLALQYPIYVPQDSTDCSFKFRVVINKQLSVLSCEPQSEYVGPGLVLWESTACYATIEEVTAAYQLFYSLTGNPLNCYVFCNDGNYQIGFRELMVVSSETYNTPEEAWDVNFPETKDVCGDCVPLGLRQFIYAAEDDRNFICFKVNDKWRFKVVDSSYFVAKFNCFYLSAEKRDSHQQKVQIMLDNLQWFNQSGGGGGNDDGSIDSNNDGVDNTDDQDNDTLSEGGVDTINKMVARKFTLSRTDREEPDRDRYDPYREACEIIHEIRNCLDNCSKDNGNHDPIQCVIALFSKGKGISIDPDQALEYINIAINFPVYKTEEGFCFKVYASEMDTPITPDGLQPCGCGDESEDPNVEICNTVHPFVSSRCYSCCTLAYFAYLEFCALVKSGQYTIKETVDRELCRYSFEIIDESKVIGYHAQQYDCLPEVKAAIERTKDCLKNEGMHLMEHILLRPTSLEECSYQDDSVNEAINCLLPICPDYCCPIEWQIDADPDDPCPGENLEYIHVLPGADPYSFWATVALPSWPKRFRDQKTRRQIEQLLYREAPAMVGLNILWLSPMQMCKFEDEYYNWLQWKSGENIYTYCSNTKMPKICPLVDCFKQLVSEPACSNETDDGGDCNCDVTQVEVPQPDDCCLPLITDGSIFWMECTSKYSIEGNLPDGKDKHAEIDKDVLIKDNPTANKHEDTAKGKGESKTSGQAENRNYLVAVNKSADAKLRRTKSYQHVVSFIENEPSMKQYIFVLQFIIKNALGRWKGVPNEIYLSLLKNCSYHIWDHFSMTKQNGLTPKEVEEINECIGTMIAIGIPKEILLQEWQVEALEGTNETPKSQILNLLA